MIGATEKPDWPVIVNLRLDPFERTGVLNANMGSLDCKDWKTCQMWRFAHL